MHPQRAPYVHAPFAASCLGSAVPSFAPGFIFIAKHGQVEEALRTLVFASASNFWSLVEKVQRGTKILIYDTTKKVMHGVFVAVTPGIYNLEPFAFRGSQKGGSPLPAQVRVEVDVKFPPLPVSHFRHIRGLFADNNPDWLHRILTTDKVAAVMEVFHAATQQAASLQPGLVLQHQGPGPSEPWPTPQVRERAELFEQPAQSLGPPGFQAQPSFGPPQHTIFASQPVLRPAEGLQRQLPEHLASGGQAAPWTGPLVAQTVAATSSVLQTTTILPRLKRPLPIPMAVPKSNTFGKTTVVMENIPSCFSGVQLADLLDDNGFMGTYDFLYYQRAKHENNKGKLVINLSSHGAADAIFGRISTIQRLWPATGKGTPLVHWHTIHGTAQLRNHYPAAPTLNGYPADWQLPEELPMFFNLSAAAEPSGRPADSSPAPPQQMEVPPWAGAPPGVPVPKKRSAVQGFSRGGNRKRRKGLPAAAARPATDPAAGSALAKAAAPQSSPTPAPQLTQTPAPKPAQPTATKAAPPDNSTPQLKDAARAHPLVAQEPLKAAQRTPVAATAQKGTATVGPQKTLMKMGAQDTTAAVEAIKALPPVQPGTAARSSGGASGGEQRNATRAIPQAAQEPASLATTRSDSARNKTPKQTAAGVGEIKRPLSWEEIKKQGGNNRQAGLGALNSAPGLGLKGQSKRVLQSAGEPIKVGTSLHRNSDVDLRGVVAVEQRRGEGPEEGRDPNLESPGVDRGVAAALAPKSATTESAVRILLGDEGKQMKAETSVEGKAADGVGAPCKEAGREMLSGEAVMEMLSGEAVMAVNASAPTNEGKSRGGVDMSEPNYPFGEDFISL